MTIDATVFTQNITQVHGQTGVDWLESLPVIVADCAQRWSLNLQPHFENLSYNFVAPAVQAGSRAVVLKAGVVKDGVPDRELLSEHDALSHFDGQGMVRLLDADLKVGVMLLERLTPGTPLKTIADDERATRIAAEVMKALWKSAPAEHTFPSVVDWAAGLRRLRVQFDGGCGPFPAQLVEKAEALFTELIDSMDEAVLLHGDLHQNNILMSERRPWLGIDPKGVIGEPAYETGAFLRNIPLRSYEGQAKKQLARAVDQFTEQLALDRQRIVKWGIAQAVLSAWWSFEDHGEGWEPDLLLAELLEALV
jgi:streptomycin 6-kinase